MSILRREKEPTLKQQTYKPLNYEDLKDSFDSEGYGLLNQEYIFGEKLRFICPAGHQHSMAAGHWKMGKRCAYCAGNGRVSYEQVMAIVNSVECDLLTTREQYRNTQIPLEMLCRAKGHFRKSSYANICKFPGCRECFWKSVERVVLELLPGILARRTKIERLTGESILATILGVKKCLIGMVMNVRVVPARKTCMCITF